MSPNPSKCSVSGCGGGGRHKAFHLHSMCVTFIRPRLDEQPQGGRHTLKNVSNEILVKISIFVMQIRVKYG